MNNELIIQKTWINRNWKWFFSSIIVLILAISLFFTLTAGHLGDFSKAYLEPQLFEGAVELAQQNKEVTELLGEIKPISKMAILEGEVQYTNQSNHVTLSVKVDGTKMKAMLDVVANRKNDGWEYEKINIRVKNPPEKRQTIVVK